MAVNSAYKASAQEISELFADYIEGNGDQPALALSAAPLPDPARGAILKSLAAFGYDNDACLFATLAPRDPRVEGGDIQLDAQALFLLVEGLDPLYVIAADRDATNLLGQAYRSEFPLDSPIRAFGRPAVAFADLSALLQTDPGKQKAWQILKSLVA